MSKRTIIVLAGIVLLLVGWWTCHRRGSSADAQTSGRNATSGPGPGGGAVPVVAAKVEEKDVPVYLDGLGTVQAFNTVTVHARVDGELVKVGFVEGQDVHAGDVLAQIDPDPFRTQLKQTEAKNAQ